MPDTSIRFTPDELKELVDKGLLKEEHLARLHPSDQQVALSLFAKPPQTGPVQLPSDGPRPMLDRFISGAMGQQLPSDVPSALGALTTALPIGYMASKLAKFALPGKAPAQAASAMSDAEAATTLLGKDPWANAGGEAVLLGKQNPKNVSHPPTDGYSGLDATEAAERVPKGIQHDFRGRVTFDRSANAAGPRSAPAPRREFPPGADRSTPPAQFKELLDSYAESQGDPQKVEALRQYLAQLLRQRK